MSTIDKKLHFHLPEMKQYESLAVDTVIRTINQAMYKLGVRMNLHELALSAKYAFADNKVSLKKVRPPLAITAEKFIAETIENHWNLTEVFKYYLRYTGHSKDEISQYYYYEAIFSQPTAEYPIPQATVSVFFRVEEQPISLVLGVPSICFRIEGHHTDHDVRYVALSADWLLAVIQMKLKFYQRIEDFKLF